MTTATLKMTNGLVRVLVPLHDCDGVQRSIDFPRIGDVLYGSPLLHWTARPWLRIAQQAARKALKSGLVEADLGAAR